MMRSSLRLCACSLLALAAAAIPVCGGDKPLQLQASQKSYLTHEPLLMTVRAEGTKVALPAADKGDASLLRFDVKPPLKARPTIKPLLVESKVDPKAAIASRRYDLLEWLQFPAEGTFTVTAVLQANGVTMSSEPVTFSIARPAKGDKEWGPVDRLHHLPWCSYVTDAFCGDTFDLVKQWPDSQLAVYAHYWNGLHLQNKKEHAKAVESFQTVLTKYPTSVLVPSARIGLVEGLTATGKLGEARAALEPIFAKSDTAVQATDSERAVAASLRKGIALEK